MKRFAAVPALVVAALSHPPAVVAQTEPGRPAASASAAAGEIAPQVVEQKSKMVERLLYDSPAAARVSGSANQEARRHLNNARELHSHARSLTGTGQTRAADALLNDAIREIGRAQQLVPDQTARLVDERARFLQLKSSVDALLRTYEIGLHRGAVGGRQDDLSDRSVGQALKLVDQARQLADGERLPEANRAMDQALTLLLKDSLTRVEGKTLIYDRRFATPKDEYEYELQRHRSFEKLVPLAILEFRPSQQAVVLIDRYLQQARSLRERAEQQAAANDQPAAIRSLVEGTDVLQRALQAAGLSVPQSMGSP